MVLIYTSVSWPSLGIPAVKLDENTEYFLDKERVKLQRRSRRVINFQHIAVCDRGKELEERLEERQTCPRHREECWY